MHARIVLEPVSIAAGWDNDGRLIMIDGRLAGVLVRLDELHGERAGAWFLEVGFGALSPVAAERVFATIESALDWLSGVLEGC
jgi:hypothetical protein